MQKKEVQKEVCRQRAAAFCVCSGMDKNMNGIRQQTDDEMMQKRWRDLQNTTTYF